MTFFVAQIVLAFACAAIAHWRMYVPGDRVAPLFLGAGIAFFLSIWSAAALIDKV